MVATHQVPRAWTTAKVVVKAVRAVEMTATRINRGG
jgi:hypothetical protein